MILQLRKNHQITARTRRLAMRANAYVGMMSWFSARNTQSGGRSQAAVWMGILAAATLGLFGSSACAAPQNSAQSPIYKSNAPVRAAQPPSDGNTRASTQKQTGMFPPVHLFPKPRYEHGNLGYGQRDPGLPRSMNGKFNSTHKIQRDDNTGPRMRLTDAYSHNRNRATRRDRVESVSRTGFQDKVSRAFQGVRTKQTNDELKLVRRPTHAPPKKDRLTVGTTFPVAAPELNQTTDSTAFSRQSNAPMSTPEPNHFASRQREQSRVPMPLSQYGSLRTPPISSSYDKDSAQIANASMAEPKLEPARHNDRPQVQVVTAQEPVDDPFGDLNEIRDEFLKTQSHKEDAQPISVLNRPAPAFNSKFQTSPQDIEADGTRFQPTNDPLNIPTRPLGQESQDDTIRGFENESILAQDLTGEGIRSTEQSCEHFRKALLDNPISSIALDISPLGTGRPATSPIRTWTDQNGAELATGKMIELRRGYVLVETNNGLVKLPQARLCDADWAMIAETWRIPVECGLGPGNFAGRNWVPQTITWKASALCHKPLYFENVALERYGHSHGPFLQPVDSTIHFFGSLMLLPYNMGFNPPNECQYALGFYRPGNCAPWLKYSFPLPDRLINRRMINAFRGYEMGGY